MAVHAEQALFLDAFKSALSILQDDRFKIPRQPIRTVRRDLPFGTLLEQYCASQKDLTCTSDVLDGRNKFTYHLSAEFFRIDFRMLDGVVTEACVVHERKTVADQLCPEMALSLRCRDMHSLNLNIRGFLDMYPPARDKIQRGHLYTCLDTLDKDLKTIFLHSESSGMSAVDLAHTSPFGLICPRREGLPSRICFLVAPRDLVRGGKMLTDLSYCSIAAQRLGHWASIVIKESPQPYRLARTSLLKKNAGLTSEMLGSDAAFLDVTEASPVELSGSFRMVFAKPFPVFEATFKDVQKITGIKPNVVPGLPSRRIWESLPEGKGHLGRISESGEFFVVLPGHHHCYRLDDSLPSTETVVDIPFTSLRQIPALVRILRKQAVLNELLSSCMRSSPAGGVTNPFRFHVSVSPLDTVLIEFEHPLDSSLAKLELTLSDPSTMSCAAVYCQPRLVTDEAATRFLRRTMSIPVMLKTCIDSFVQNYSPIDPPVHSVIPEPELPPPSPIQRSNSVVEIPYIPDQSPSNSNSLPSTPDVIQLPLTPQTPGTPSPQIISPPRFTKIESILANSKHSKFSLPFKNVPAFAADAGESAERMKELYDSNARKMASKLETSIADDSGSKLKLKKRKISADMGMPPAIAIPNEPVAKYSAQLRTNTDESPHGSPLTVKFSKQPVNTDANASSSKEGLLPKKKKLKSVELITPMSNAPILSKTPEVKKAKPSELESLLIKKRATLVTPPVALKGQKPAPSLASVLGGSPSKSATQNLTKPGASPGPPRTASSSKYSPGLKAPKSGMVSPAKSPTVAGAPPVFSQPKIPSAPSINSLGRIPKKSPGGSVLPVTLPGPPVVGKVFPPGIIPFTAAELNAVKEISSLWDEGPPRGPLLPTPVAVVAPKITPTDKIAPLASTAEPMSANMIELTRSFDEDVKKATEASVADAANPTTAKARNRSISAVLDRLKSQKSRAEPSENSLDSTDMQDAVFKQLSASGDSNEPSENLNTIPSSSVVAPTTTDSSAENVSQDDASKAGLVPYLEDDSSEEGDLKAGVEAAQLQARSSQQSPEFLDPKQSGSQFPVLAVAADAVGEVKANVALVASSPIPKIDEELFDAAFFMSDEAD